MRRFFILFNRELKSYLCSPTIYIVVCAFLVLGGLNLFVTLDAFNGQPRPYYPIEIFFNNAIFWFGYIILVPILTMRLYCEEFKMGTIETLMTAPVKDSEVVLAKFASAWALYLLIWLPTFVFFVVFELIARQPAAASLGALFGTYFFIMVMGLFYISIGCLTSVLTQNQIVAAVLSFIVIVSLFFIGILAGMLPNIPQIIRDVLGYFASANHMIDFTRGILDTRPVVLYLSAAFLLQVITFQLFQYRKWKF